MEINFNYHGATYHAGLAKQDESHILVLLKDNSLKKQFGSSLPFYVQNKTVGFDILNRSHSDLYAINSTISKAISEQCEEIL